jgi:hypothetical protein
MKPKPKLTPEEKARQIRDWTFWLRELERDMDARPGFWVTITKRESKENK